MYVILRLRSIIGLLVILVVIAVLMIAILAQHVPAFGPADTDPPARCVPPAQKAAGIDL